MDKVSSEYLIKRYRLKHIVSLAVTVLSVYFWINFFDWSPLKIIGLSANIAGLGIWWSAKLTLGENWGVGFGKPGLKKLVTNGIYSKIRHPMYWGINLTLAGLALLYPRVWFLITCLLIAIYFFQRMARENRYLSEKLWEEYQSYKSKTWIRIICY